MTELQEFRRQKWRCELNFAFLVLCAWTLLTAIIQDQKSERSGFTMLGMLRGKNFLPNWSLRTRGKGISLSHYIGPGERNLSFYHTIPNRACSAPSWQRQQKFTDALTAPPACQFLQRLSKSSFTICMQGFAEPGRCSQSGIMWLHSKNKFWLPNRWKI